jgi:DNA replication protein DnaC
MPAKKSSPTPKPAAWVSRLDAEVKRRQARDTQMQRQRNAETFGVHEAGKIIPDAVNRIRQMGEEMQAKLLKHREKYLAELQSVPPTLCNLHLDEKCEVDIEASLTASYAPDTLTVIYSECPLCKHDRLVNEKCKKWLRMGCPVRTADATFENFITDGNAAKCEVKKRVQTQAARRSGFSILLGTMGTGKTHLACALLKYFEKGIFVTQAELVDELRGCYDNGGKEKMVAKYQKTECLILDEIDADIKGADITPFLYRILSYRYDRNLITCLTSNLDLTNLLEILGPRLADRMTQNYTVAIFNWESFRKKNRIK